MTPEQNAHVKTLTTREEIFDYVESHLKEQGCRSIRTSWVTPDYQDCLYRGEGGTMCAVGCLLADDEYEPAMEGMPLLDLVRNWSCMAEDLGLDSVFPARLIPHAQMLADLQELHDRQWNWSSDGGLSIEGLGQLRELRAQWLDESEASSDPPDSN